MVRANACQSIYLWAGVRPALSQFGLNRRGEQIVKEFVSFGSLRCLADDHRALLDRRIEIARNHEVAAA